MQMEKETQMKKLLYLLVMLSLLLAVVPVATASAQAAVACEEDILHCRHNTVIHAAPRRVAVPTAKQPESVTWLHRRPCVGDRRA